MGKLTFFMLWAQAANTEYAGWAGTGLVGMVLGWLLLKYLPYKDEQLERLTANHRLEIQTLGDKFLEQLRIQATQYDESLQRVVEHCDQEIARFSQLIDKLTEQLTHKLNKPPGVK